jgi:hypothetical protein
MEKIANVLGDDLEINFRLKDQSVKNILETGTTKSI